MEQPLTAAVRLLYPERCLFCGEILTGRNTTGVCGACAHYDRAIDGAVCGICGGPLARGAACCEERAPLLDGGRALWVYDEPHSKAVLDLKFKHRLENVHKIAQRAAAHIQEAAAFADIHFVAPVPLHRAKRIARGFNQAELLAGAMAKALGIAMENGVLLRRRNTPPQMNLNFAQRLENLDDAMQVRHPERVCGRRILLIDDIFTSGATMNECAKVLKNAGAAAVYSYCICVAGRGTSGVDKA